MQSSQVIQGMVFKRSVQCDITKVADAKLAVYTCEIASMQTETKVITLNIVPTSSIYSSLSVATQF